MARRASPEGNVFFWLQRLLASLHEDLHSRVPCAPELHPSPRLAPPSGFATLIPASVFPLATHPSIVGLLSGKRVNQESTSLNVKTHLTAMMSRSSKWQFRC